MMVTVARRANSNGARTRGQDKRGADARSLMGDDEPMNKANVRPSSLPGYSQAQVRSMLLLLVLGSAFAAASMYYYVYANTHMDTYNNVAAALVETKTRSAGTSTTTTTTTTTSTIPADAELREEARVKYQNCTLSFVPPPPRKEPSEWRKPLWVTSYPASGSASHSKKGDITKQLIDKITGLPQATKNYHMSIKGGKLRRCKGVSETAACTQGHPYVPVGPDTQTQNFQSSVILSVRNFATAFPATHTDKNIAYHGADGQPPEEEWRTMRDQYIEGSLQTWLDMIRWWRNADYYRIALYLPFEWLLSPTKGPELVQQLANLYQQAGFEVAPPEDIPCIWYKSVWNEWTRQGQLAKYTPGYTKEQQEFIVKEFDVLMKESESLHDRTLVEILREYKEEILAAKTTKLDPLANNRTAASSAR